MVISKLKLGVTNEQTFGGGCIDKGGPREQYEKAK